MDQCRRWQRNRLFQISEPTEIWKPSTCIPFSRLVPRTYWRHPPRPSALSELGTVYCPNSSCRDNRYLFPRPLLVNIPANGRPVFSKKAAILISMIVALIIIQSGSFQLALHLFPLLTLQPAIFSERSTISHLSRPIRIVRDRDSCYLVRCLSGHALVAPSFESGSANSQALYR